MEHGLEKLTDEEVLELLLSFGTPRKDCKQVARAMLKEFGTIRDVFEAGPELLARIVGAGPTNIVAIKFIHAVAGRFLEKRLLGRDYLGSTHQVVEYLRHNLESLDKELFKVIHLDNNRLILAIEDISRGTIGEAYVHPREVIERGIALRSSGLIFVHNHPGGNIYPSESDQRLTRRLVHLAYLAEMVTIDHIIIGQNGEYFSFKDEGMINLYEQEVNATYRIIPEKGSGGDLLHEINGLTYQPRKKKSRVRPAKETIANSPSRVAQVFPANDPGKT